MIYEITIICFSLFFLLFSFTENSVKNLKEFTLGKTFSNFEIMISWIAVIASVRYVAQIIMQSFIFGIFSIIDLAADLFRKYIYAYLVRYLVLPIKTPTMSEAYATIFKTSNNMRMIMSITILIPLIGGLASSLIYLDKIFTSILNIKYAYVYEIFILFAIAYYTTKGGITSVIKTDKIQVVIFLLVIPFFLMTIIQNINIDISKISFIYHVTTDVNENNSPIPSVNYDKLLMEILPMIIIGILPIHKPSSYQRIVTCSSRKQAATTMFMSANAIFIFGVIFSVIGICIRNIYHNENGNFNVDKKSDMFSIAFLIDNMSGSGMYTILYKIIFICALLALFMSTVDTLANILSSYVSNDILHGYNLSDSVKISIAGFAVWVCFILSWIISYAYLENNISIIYIFNISMFFGSIYTSMFAGILDISIIGFVPKRSHTFIGAAVGITVNIIIWSLYLNKGLFADNILLLRYILPLRTLIPLLSNLTTVIILSFFANPKFFKRKTMDEIINYKH